MNHYVIKKSTSTINWHAIEALTINHFPWYTTGKKQKTQVKLTTNSDTLFIHIVAQDNYSFAQHTDLNHPLVCEDSCVECFFSPSGVLGSSYVNLEVNCCGTLHMAYGDGRNGRTYITTTDANLITCRSSITSLVKVESKRDEQWTIEICIPFDVIERLTGEQINKTTWYGNFYRCGGRKAPQFAVWNNIDSPTPDYHRPEHFGKLLFETDEGHDLSENS